ncbi:putative nucleotidyltransferase with HDIG domain [Catenuloplanes nepalensis]|uniref:Nucleotidyltransferase with HDIG domain n=1 Tax=Catenuloplanes nepalensis TaxID=587533 RepID=A0ABT9MV39_9ACTN|nr:HDIG domain-containing metalloprotein [Catenuloplanes nepalensis]MDP9795255.1 putative nucleotidyltransferase with HDIG domain [Catenuloplanes nepalensis]
MSSVLLRPTADAARELAQRVIGDLGNRWLHTAAVAARAEQLATVVPAEDREILVASAWLHDIGYGELAHATGFHPLDGARLLDHHGWPTRISGLVANHSGACFVAAVHGLKAEMAVYPDEATATSDALTYADQTVGSRGEPLGIDARIADMLHRHGPGSPNATVAHLRTPHIQAIASRVQSRLATALH